MKDIQLTFDENFDITTALITACARENRDIEVFSTFQNDTFAEELIKNSQDKITRYSKLIEN